MSSKTAIKLAAAVSTLLICCCVVSITYGVVYAVCWCFDIAITLKVATGIVICAVVIYNALKSIFGGSK